MSQETELLQEMWTPLDGVSIYTRVSTTSATLSKPPIILLHGFVISSRYMVPLAQRLAPYFQVYAPDFPGFGQSGPPRKTHDIAGLADMVARWMDTVGIDRAILLGNSLGCQVAAKFAANHPTRVTQLILTGPTVNPKARTILEQGVALLRDIPHERPSLIFIHIPDQIRAGPWRILQTARYAMQDRIEDTLPLIQVPTLVVRGRADPLVPQWWAENVTALLPRGRLVVVPGTGHAVNYSSPERLACVVRTFLHRYQEVHIGNSGTTLRYAPAG